jgi:hypothetical protein
MKFLKKTDWAREKVEGFYLYQFKNLPKASSDQFSLSPRDRIIPEGQIPGEPAELDLEDAERLREKREKKAVSYEQESRNHSQTKKRFGDQKSHYAESRNNNRSRKPVEARVDVSASSIAKDVDPWAKARKKLRN